MLSERKGGERGESQGKTETDIWRDRKTRVRCERTVGIQDTTALGSKLQLGLVPSQCQL